MRIFKKIKTIFNVFKTFGRQGLIDLILSKRNLSAEVAAPKETDFEQLGLKPMILDSQNINEILDFQNVIAISDEYNLLRDSWIEKFSAPRSQFFKQVFDLGDSMGLLVYCYVRLMNPQRVIETGVAAGVSTSIVLEALRRNENDGELVSIDITEKVGEVIPNHLKENWSLEVLSKRNHKNSLVSLLIANQNCEVFLHDSNHSNDWQIFEFTTALDELKNCSVLFFDDVAPLLVGYVKRNHPEIRIYILNEGRKFSGVFLR
jgi:predicted O-methyltransferase YrrM